MTKKDHTAIPRYRSHEGPALLAQGFRPFFFLAGLWAPLALLLSLEMIQGRIELPTVLDAVSWHYHEMLFGFVVAAIAGFLLTAIPNWTGRLPLQGLPLLGLVVLWLAGRAAMASSALIGAWPATLIDLSFLLALAAVTFREIMVGRNWRNLPVVLAIVLLLLCNALFHGQAMGLVDAEGLGWRFSVAIVTLLITLIGGRMIPSFTRNWLAKRDAEVLPKPFGRFDKAVLVFTFLALALWAAQPDGTVTASLLALAAVIHLIRLARWCSLATLGEPLLWILHLGYLWIPIGLALLAVSHWYTALPASGGLHALTVGAMGTMTLAVMSRAILGHTGRDLRAGTGLILLYLLITVAALLRVGAALSADNYPTLLTIAGAAWVSAFLVFLAVCGPMLVTRSAESGDR